MTEYRAIIRGVQSERPIQTITRTLADVEDWVACVFRSHPAVKNHPAIAEVYEVQEKLIKTLHKPEEKNPA